MSQSENSGPDPTGNMGLPQNYGMTLLDDTQVNIPFPAATKQVAGNVNGVKTDVMYISFADKIMITITQNGRLGQWVCNFPSEEEFVSHTYTHQVHCTAT